MVEHWPQSRYQTWHEAEERSFYEYHENDTLGGNLLTVSRKFRQGRRSPVTIRWEMEEDDCNDGRRTEKLRPEGNGPYQPVWRQN